MSTRLFVSDALGNGARLVLGGEQARYLGRALRCRVGDAVTVFNGSGGEWAATIERIGKSDVELRVGEHSDPPLESRLDIELIQGISRGERMDFVVQKATELGVRRITPVLSDHGVVKLDPKRADKRRDHWQRVAESACEQSGRTRPPDVDAPIALNTWFGSRTQGSHTELILKPGTEQSLADVEAPTAGVRLLVGPEGGFSDREYEDARIAGITAVSLGPRILRTETAALAALTLAQNQWGDL